MSDTEASVAARSSASRSNFSWAGALGGIVLIAIAAAAFVYGLELRRYAWDATQGVRFRGDIAAGWHWGGRALDRGLFTFYDDLEAEVRSGQGRRNDYPPLRLSVMTAWTRWTRQHYPAARTWQADYDFTAPMLRANTAAEGASSVLVFGIIVLLKRRMDRAWPATDAAPGRRFHFLRAAAAGLFGALLFWFNPAVIWDSHCWPQWDVWLMPLFLAAVMAACLDAWFVAGVCVVLGACLKGQMLLGAPVLLLWPIFRGHFGAALRLVSGVVVAAALIALPWMHLAPAAWTWLTRLVAAVALLEGWALASRAARRRHQEKDVNPDTDTDATTHVPDATARAADASAVAHAPRRLAPRRWGNIGDGLIALRHGPPFGWIWTLVVVTVALALAWPWRSDAPFATRMLAWTPLAIVAAAGGLRPRLHASTTALALATAVLLTMPLLGGGTGWLTMGFLHGAEKFEHMFTGSGSWNVPAMLIRYGQWTRDQNQRITLPGLGDPVTAKTLLRGLYAGVLVLCGISAAWHAKQRDTRLVVPMVVPWLSAFMLLPQMHGRYTVWAAGFCALLAADSIGLALLGGVVSTVAWLGIMENQYLFVPDYAPDTLALLRRLDPHLGWVLLLATVILLYKALTFRAPPEPRLPNSRHTPPKRIKLAAPQKGS